jgi:hypothetical protein
MNNELIYIKHEDVDNEKWNHLVSLASEANIFCYDWYLNPFCKWDIVVLDDYEGGLVLPIGTRYGIKTIYQPNFIQKCNWIGKELSDSHINKLVLLLRSIASHVRFNTNIPLGEVTQRTNLILNLSDDIAMIRANYSKSLKHNLKKSSARLDLYEVSQPENIIALYQARWGKLNPQLASIDYNTLQQLIIANPERFDCFEICLADECIAGMIIAKGKNRLHYILGAGNDKAQELNAVSYGLDAILHKYSESNYIFDFEGSSIPSVKSFYERFGAVDEPFYQVDLTHRWIKTLKSFYKRLAKS